MGVDVAHRITVGNHLAGIARPESMSMSFEVLQCGEEHKLFHRLINKKSKHRESIARLGDESMVCEDLKEISEQLNASFQKTITK